MTTSTTPTAGRPGRRPWTLHSLERGNPHFFAEQIAEGPLRLERA